MVAAVGWSWRGSCASEWTSGRVDDKEEVRLLEVEARFGQGRSRGGQRKPVAGGELSSVAGHERGTAAG